jgi:hypothetical protein
MNESVHKLGIVDAFASEQLELSTSAAELAIDAAIFRAGN